MTCIEEPPAERQADTEMVLRTIGIRGVVAGRRMMAALGLPTIRDELCYPPNVLDVRHGRSDPDLRDAGRFEPVENLDP